MVGLRYVDGAKVLPSDDEVKKLRPADAMNDRLGRASSRSIPRRDRCGRRGRRAVRLRRSHDRLSASSFQALNGLAGASALFLVAAGLSLIFGVTRIVNFAHGSLYMLGIYIAYTLADAMVGGGARLLGRQSLLAALRRRRDRRADRDRCCCGASTSAPELFQLLATFALVLVINDATLWLWGPEDLLGPRAPGLRGSVEILGRRFPSYDLFLIVVGPLVLVRSAAAAHAHALRPLVRAATQDREMVGALGVNQALLFTAVFALGALLAGLGGALQLPREPANLGHGPDADRRRLRRGRGRRHGLDPRRLSRRAAHRRDQGALHRHRRRSTSSASPFNFSKLTLVAEFLVMAVVLIVRP